MYFYSKNEKSDYIEIRNISTAQGEDYDPSFYIKFNTIHGLKLRWEYLSKELRDKDINEITEHLKNKK